MSEIYLDRNRFAAIAYNAVGRASEVNNLNVYQLQHSTGNSGWSVGLMQWDFGQGLARQAKVDELLNLYQAHAVTADRFSAPQLADLAHRLKTPGQVGNTLSQLEQLRLNGFLRSDTGRAFVAGLDDSQLQRKWDKVGEPLSRMDWLQALGRDHPDEVHKIVAMTAKLFNQNETRGGRLLAHLSDHPMNADETHDWICSTGVEGLNTAAQAAIRSGCDNALRGAELLARVEGSPTIAGRAWSEAVIRNLDPGLTRDFSCNPDAQLLDKIFRDPGNGNVLLDKMERGASSPFRMPGTREAYAVTLGVDGCVTTSLNGRGYRMAPDGSRVEVTEAQPVRDALHRAAQAQLGPALLANGRSDQDVDTVAAACVQMCRSDGSLGDPERFMLSKDGTCVAMLFRDRQFRELLVDAALARSPSGEPAITPSLVLASPECIHRVR